MSCQRASDRSVPGLQRSPCPGRNLGSWGTQRVHPSPPLAPRPAQCELELSLPVRIQRCSVHAPSVLSSLGKLPSALPLSHSHGRRRLEVHEGLEREEKRCWSAQWTFPRSAPFPRPDVQSRTTGIFPFPSPHAPFPSVSTTSV